MPREMSPRKSLGQHWLNDIDSLNAIVQSANINPNDTILEIGPGMGHLTQLLAKHATRVIAVELDDELASQLLKQVPGNVEVINQDILHFDLTILPADYKIVANIPYYLTSHLIRLISESINPPLVAVLLVQKEVAQRIDASPGQMSLLSVGTQFYWQTSIGRIVDSKLFTPPPKVDSQILILKRRLTVLFPEVDIRSYFRIVRAGFAGRRKTLLNSLSGGLRLAKEDINEVLIDSDIDSKSRAQNLSLDDWHRIYLATLPLLNHNT